MWASEYENDRTFHIWVSDVFDKLALLMHFNMYIHTYTYVCLITSNV